MDIETIRKQQISDIMDHIAQLKAENARLQAIIDEANAQEPVGVFNGKFNVSINDKITFEVNCYDALPEAGARLYAAPIPAQQSPAVAVTDEMKEALILAIELLNDDCSFGKAELLQGLLDNGYLQSPRITEQDAREIINSYAYSWEGSNVKPSCFNIWHESLGGRALLEKINK